MREALLNLEQENIVIRKHGVGTFVAPGYGRQLVSGLERLESLLELASKHGARVRVADLTVVLQAGEYEDHVAMNSSWAEGDWNGDGDFNSSDLVAVFVAGGYEQGPRAEPAAVPEPSAAALMLAAAWLLMGRKRQ